MSSYICYNCFEVLINYSAYRAKYIENHQKLEQLLLNAEQLVAEDGSNVIEYEEIELRDENGEQIIIEDETEEVEEFQQEQQSDDDEEEELKLEDIVKPEFLHYCLPKKEPEPVKKVFHVPRQLEKKKRKLEAVLKEQTNHDTEFICQECGKSCPSLDSLDQHMNRYHRKFICDYQECAKVCSSQSQLDKHVALMHKNILYECPECDKKFYEKLHLKNHMYIHSQ